MYIGSAECLWRDKTKPCPAASTQATGRTKARSNIKGGEDHNVRSGHLSSPDFHYLSLLQVHAPGPRFLNKVSEGRSIKSLSIAIPKHNRSLVIE
jgi:hypothetical protein